MLLLSILNKFFYVFCYLKSLNNKNKQGCILNNAKLVIKFNSKTKKNDTQKHYNPPYSGISPANTTSLPEISAAMC